MYHELGGRCGVKRIEESKFISDVLDMMISAHIVKSNVP